MKKSVPIVALLASLFAPHPLSAAGDSAAAGAMVRLYGSPVVMEKVFEPARDGLRDSLGVGLFLAGIGEANGLESLINGECEAAMLSSPLEDAVAEMTRYGRREIPTDLRRHPVASERVWVIVNPSNPVRSISLRDLEGIYRGRITNWRELGGPDLRIVPVQPPSGTAARKTLIRDLLAGNPDAIRGIETQGAKDTANYVRFLDGAIGAMPIPDLPPNYMKFRIVETGEIRYGLYLVTRGAPSPELGRVLDFLNADAERTSRN
ncbi:MAG: substrate-binding domain-containing protein [Deltaproteobacteria bacterium]|nr:substrate-binding domain-containing protein [Deltaproteobacteria bacterium]